LGDARAVIFNNVEKAIRQQGRNHAHQPPHFESTVSTDATTPRLEMDNIRAFFLREFSCHSQ
jgi:hypothetical protein